MVAYILLWFSHYFPIHIPLNKTNYVFQNYTKFDIRRKIWNGANLYVSCAAIRIASAVSYSL